VDTRCPTIHWPQGGPKLRWPGMERARERGLTRSIGVSNFNVRDPDAAPFSKRASSAA
jgi:diketogulonate reductase-like aldo/keto reductase